MVLGNQTPENQQTTKAMFVKHQSRMFTELTYPYYGRNLPIQAYRRRRKPKSEAAYSAPLETRRTYSHTTSRNIQPNPPPAMPPLRFPYALGIGTDICHVPRIARIITRRDEGGVEQFARKIFNGFEGRIFSRRLQRYRAARDAARWAGRASNRTASEAEVAALNAFARWVAGR